MFPIRIASCNLHGAHTRRGVTALIENVRVRNLICGWVGARESRHHSNETEAASVGDTSSVTVGGASDVWVEAALMTLGPLCVDAAISSTMLHQDTQLIQNK